MNFFTLCVPQCLAHVEAFIDFSEDELMEDGVLNQGTCAWRSRRPRALKVEERRALVAQEKSCLIFLFGSSAERRVQGQNVKLPRKQFQGQERSEGQLGVGHSFKA